MQSANRAAGPTQLTAPCSDASDRESADRQASDTHALNRVAEPSQATSSATDRQSADRLAGPSKDTRKHWPDDERLDLAAALTTAKQLGLQRSVTLALQALQSHFELQLQEQQCVVAEFDLPSNAHAQECFLGWPDSSARSQCFATEAAPDEAVGSSPGAAGSSLGAVWPGPEAAQTSSSLGECG